MPELPTSGSGNQHCLLMIEHFSKWVECAMFPKKTSANTAKAFLQYVLSKFGSCAEVLTDQGTESEGSFKLCKQVPHRPLTYITGSSPG